jgi:ribosome-binding ATPase YchF (GTP1/OBG family)
MVRIFDNEEIVHVEGEVNPIRDLDIIGEELRLKDIETVENAISALEKVVQRIDKTKKNELVRFLFITAKIIDPCKLIEFFLYFYYFSFYFFRNSCKIYWNF